MEAGVVVIVVGLPLLKVELRTPNSQESGPAFCCIVFLLLPLLANCGRLDILLKWYCIASGQLINLDKSNIFFSPNVPSELRIEICDVLNIQPAVNLGK
ncbi:unnamed protein product [Prunus brigantina]